jgi:glycosyltransferase involved in cell wall biosynthesis
VKVLFFIENLSIGGAERVLLDTVKELQKSYDITVLVVYEFPNRPSFVDEMKKLVRFESVICYYDKGSWIKQISYRIRSWLRRAFLNKALPVRAYKSVVHDRYDVEVSFLEGRPTRILSGSTNRESLKYAWVHTDMIRNPWSEEYYKSPAEEQQCYRHFDRVFAVSHDVAQAFTEKFSLSATFIQNIIDDARIRRLATFAQNPFPNKMRPVLVAIGRMVPVKGYDRLLVAASRLREEHFDFELHFVGNGKSEEELREQAQILELDNVVFHGYQDNPYAYLANADLFVCSSHTEGFSSVVAESLILETPVLTTDCAGMRDLLGESEWGLIVTNDTQGIFEGLREFIRRPEHLSEYAERARRRGQDFSSGRLAETLMGFIATDMAEVQPRQERPESHEA